jgi:hypothetical protein
MPDSRVINVLVQSSEDEAAAARGIRALQDFINRPELGISGARETEDSGTGQKGFTLGALSVFFDNGVVGALADMFK